MLQFSFSKSCFWGFALHNLCITSCNDFKIASCGVRCRQNDEAKYHININIISLVLCLLYLVNILEVAICDILPTLFSSHRSDLYYALFLFVSLICSNNTGSSTCIFPPHNDVTNCPCKIHVKIFFRVARNWMTCFTVCEKENIVRGCLATKLNRVKKDGCRYMDRRGKCVSKVVLPLFAIPWLKIIIYNQELNRNPRNWDTFES